MTTVDVLFGFAYQPDVRVRRTTQALADAGYTVRIFAWDRTGDLPEHEHDGAVEVRRVHVASRQGRGWTQLFYLARAVARYVPHVVQRRPDVLHAVDLPMLLAAILLAPFAGRPVIVYDAFEIYAIMESHKYPGWLIRVLHIAERVLPRFADLVITPGEGRRAYFERRGIPSTVIPNWVDPPTRTVPRDAARRRLAIPADALAILYAGGLDPSRDLNSLVGHARRHPEHIVVIAGQGEQLPALRAVAHELPNVHILGWLPDPGDALAAADILYYSLCPGHPYAPYAAPNNLYVAMSHAVPLVYRPQGEIGLVADQHRIGRAFTDGESLDAAIAELANPDVGAAIRAGLKRLRRSYAPAIARERLLAVYPRPPIATMRSESTNGE